jgi:hypothetical protein
MNAAICGDGTSIHPKVHQQLPILTQFHVPLDAQVIWISNGLAPILYSAVGLIRVQAIPCRTPDRM